MKTLFDPIKRGRKAIDLTWKRFGRLLVVERVDRENSSHGARWKCECDCGNSIVVISSGLRRGDTNSCGCLRSEVLKKHGMTETPERKAWSSAKARCLNKKLAGYKDYGGRGIKMCDRWLNSFANFYADMGPRPSKNHSLDRKDVNGNYDPSNCRWATDKEQNNNKRNSRWIEFKGERLTLAQWAERLGMNPKSLSGRLNTPNMSLEAALTTPVKSIAKINL